MGFRKDYYVPPRYFANGKEMPINASFDASRPNILAEGVKIPAHWAADSDGTSRMTKLKLVEQRKMADRPHPTFDLDGDGHVSVKDFFLAKRFDKDGDGKLDEAEVATAKKSLADGYEKKFLFGLERAGVNQFAKLVQQQHEDSPSKEKINRIRVIQRDGAVIVGEDFSGIKPKECHFHKRSSSTIDDSRSRTKAQLLEKRRKESLSALQKSYGDLQRPKLMKTAAVSRPQSVCTALRQPRGSTAKPPSTLHMAKS